MFHFFMGSIFKKLDNPVNLLVLFVLFISLYLLLNYFIPRDLALDLQFAYSANEAYESLKTMGAEVRERYLVVIWILDTAYMLVYLLLFSGLIVRCLKSRSLAVFPLAIFILDLFENITVTLLLLKFPEESQTFGYMASFFTTTKWLAVGFFSVIFLSSLVRCYILRNQPDLDMNG